MKAVKYRCQVSITRLTRRVDFVALTQYSKNNNSKTITPSFILQLKPMAENTPIAIGFTATKKLGNAVIRSKAKRRLRAAVDDAIRLNENFNGHKTGQGYHLNLIAREKCLTEDMQEITKQLTKALKYHGFIWKN